MRVQNLVHRTSCLTMLKVHSSPLRVTRKEEDEACMPVDCCNGWQRGRNGIKPTDRIGGGRATGGKVDGRTPSVGRSVGRSVGALFPPVRLAGRHAVSFILQDLFWPRASRAYLPPSLLSGSTDRPASRSSGDWAAFGSPLKRGDRTPLRCRRRQLKKANCIERA